MERREKTTTTSQIKSIGANGSGPQQVARARKQQHTAPQQSNLGPWKEEMRGLSLSGHSSTRWPKKRDSLIKRMTSIEGLTASGIEQETTQLAPSIPGWKDWPNGPEQPGSRRSQRVVGPEGKLQGLWPSGGVGRRERDR